MKPFRTPVQPLTGHSGLVTLQQPVVMLGSCFSDNVGTRLSQDLFDCDVNPFGTLYNPASIAQAMLDILYGRRYTESDLFEHEGLWHSFSHHSRFSSSSPVEMLENINRRLDRCRLSLEKASVLVVTFGTAWIYREKGGGKVVANCHKLHPDTFTREMLSVTSVIGLWKKMLREIAARFPELKVVFTVSPIRHLADGFHENQVSKSTLLLAVDRLVSEFPDTAIYFPAYEIMMDDLRDYRFYASDMVHPSEVAIEYIYDLFKQSFMDEATIRLTGETGKLYRRLAHRSLSDDAEIIEKSERQKEILVADAIARYPFLKPALTRLVTIQR